MSSSNFIAGLAGSARRATGSVHVCLAPGGLVGLQFHSV
jgi:hypothetical protein